jgi:hypothetical protein
VATEQEILNLIYQYQGADALKQAKQDLEDAKAATAALGDQFKQGAIDEAAFREGIRFQARTIADSKEKIEAFERAARGGASGMAGFGQSTLQAGRIIQDFTQGGLAGVLNNIEGLVMALGGPAGLAGILTIVGVGFYVLKPKIEEFMKSLLDDAPVTFADRLEEMHKRIKELEDKPHKIAIEVDELRDAKEQVEAIEAGLKTIEQMQKTQAHYERESGRQIAETFAEAPGGAGAVTESVIKPILGEIRQTMPELAGALKRFGELQATIPAAQKALEGRRAEGIPLEEELRTEFRIQQLQEERDRLNKRINTLEQSAEEQATARAGILINAAERGTGIQQQRAREELTRRLRQAGQRDLAEDVETASPEMIRAQEGAKKALKERNEAAQKAAAAREKQARQEQEFDEEAERVYERQIAEQTRQFGGGDLGRQARAAIRGQVGAGATDEQIRARMQADLAGQLVQGGANRITAPDVATRLIGDLTRDVRQNLGRDAQKIGEELTRQGEQNQRAGEQEARRQEQEAQAQARKSGAPYVPFAERALVELQQQGGVFDPHRGRVLPLNQEQQQAFVARQAAQAVQARNPQMAPGMARDIGGRIAGMAAASLGKRQAQLTAQGVGHTDALMMITATLNNEQARLQQQLMRQGAQIQALGQNVQARTKPAGRGPGRR